MERAANARNRIALAHLHSASLHCRGRGAVPRRSATAHSKDSAIPIKLSAMKKKKTIITLLLLMASAGHLIWFETTSHEATAQNPRAGDPRAREAGSRHFETRCAACHGADGKGGERGPDHFHRNCPQTIGG